MTTTTNVKQVKLNVMTQNQYNSATKNANELYMVTDAQINYNDLSNQPTIPTVNNATLTITQGGTTKGTFTANANSDVTIALDSGGGSVNVDNKSITTNSSDEIQTVGVINSRDSSTAIKTWTGTKAQYDAITTKDSATLYNITDDTTITQTILEALYPVGSVYITTANTCPLSTLISGSTWVQETYRQLVEKKTPTNNDPSWYNLYSDGWCEQGGLQSCIAYTNTTVSLLKSFANTNYHCFVTYNGGTGAGAAGGAPTASNLKTTSSFAIGSGGGNYSWIALGYISSTTSHKQFRRTA